MAKKNKNEITFLWGDRDREFKGDWEGKKLQNLIGSLYLKEIYLKRNSEKNSKEFDLQEIIW